MAAVLFTMADVAARMAEFGWPCGGTFIPNRSKCWTDPKTGRRLKKPINYQTYQKIQQSKSKAAQTLYKDREQAIRDKRRAAVPGWKKPKQEWETKANESVKRLLDGEEMTIDKRGGGTAKLKYQSRTGDGVNFLEIRDGNKRTQQPMMTREQLESYVSDLHNPKLDKAMGMSANPRFESKNGRERSQSSQSKPERSPSTTSTPSSPRRTKIYTEEELAPMSINDKKELFRDVYDATNKQIEEHPAFKELKETIDRSNARLYGGKNSQEFKDHQSQYYADADAYMSNVPMNAKSGSGYKIEQLQGQIRRELGLSRVDTGYRRSNRIDWDKIYLKSQQDASKSKRSPSTATSKKPTKIKDPIISSALKSNPAKIKEEDIDKEFNDWMDKNFQWGGKGVISKMNIGGGVDRAEILRRAVKSGDSQQIADALPQAIVKAGRQPTQDKTLDEIFVNRLLPYAAKHYQKLTPEQRRKWANDEYDGFGDGFGGVSKRKFEQFAGKSDTHRAIAEDLIKYAGNEPLPKTKKSKNNFSQHSSRANFGHPIKRRLKRRKPRCGCQTRITACSCKTKLLPKLVIGGKIWD